MARAGSFARRRQERGHSVRQNPEAARTLSLRHTGLPQSSPAMDAAALADTNVRAPVPQSEVDADQVACLAQPISTAQESL